MTIREIQANSAALRMEAQEMVGKAPESGLNDEQKARYAAIKNQLAVNDDMLARAAEVATFEAMKPSTKVDAENSGDVRASKEYSSAVAQYFQSVGHTRPEILAANVKTGDFATDGVVLPTVADQQIIALVNNLNVMRRLGDVVPTTQDVPYPIQSSRGAAGASDEAPGTSGSNAYHKSDSTFSTKKLQAFKITRSTYVSEEGLQDFPQLQAFLVDDLGRSIANFEENWFVNGDGSGEPEGVITAATEGKTKTDSNSTIDYVVDLQDLIGSLPSDYLNGASFLMNRSTQTYLRKLVNPSTGLPLWPYNETTLHGYAVNLSDAMPAIGVGTKPILFGNFKAAVKIGDRGNIRFQIDPYTGNEEGVIKILVNRRVDSRVLRVDGVKYLRMKTS